jgi:hypothetical protein
MTAGRCRVFVKTSRLSISIRVAHLTAVSKIYTWKNFLPKDQLRRTSNILVVVPVEITTNPTRLASSFLHSDKRSSYELCNFVAREANNEGNISKALHTPRG